MPGTAPDFQAFETLQDASVALATAVAEQLRAALATRGQALLAVPGGSTPQHFLAALGLQQLDWAHVTVMPTDERMVAPDHPQSNERMIRACFAPVADGRARYLSFHASVSDPETAARDLSLKLEAMPALDVLVCGMGEDGHIASLFPEDDGWRQASPSAHAVPGHPDGLVPRLSLSPSRLQSARWSAVLIAGEAKRNVLRAVLSGGRDLPVRLLMDTTRPATAFWGQDATA